VLASPDPGWANKQGIKQQMKSISSSLAAAQRAGVMAKELFTNGFRVVVLERGPYLTEADFTHNEVAVLMRNQCTNHPAL